MVWELILLVILMFGLGVCVGGLIVTVKLSKEAEASFELYKSALKKCKEIMDLDDKAIADLEKIHEGDKKIIEGYKKIESMYDMFLDETYDYLVKLRDDGHEDLDEVIGNIAAFMGDDLEEK